MFTGLLGRPVAHSLSPRLHNAAYRATGLNGVYLAFDIAPGDVAAAIDGARLLGCRGLNVTMPHKAEAFARCTRLTSRAQRLEALNTVWFDGSDVWGDSTDGPGFVASLAAEQVPVAGRLCTVVGAGGAARAVVEALAQAGARQVQVVARRSDAAQRAAALAGAAGSLADGVPADADLVVNATPVGMAGGVDLDGLPFAVEHLGEGAVVADLVYHPARTPVLAAAHQRGLRTVGGLGMLVHQAALSFARWWDVPPPVAAMNEAMHAGADHDPRMGLTKHLPD